MKINIIIATYKALPSLKRCLDSVNRWTRGVPYSLTVIDDCSRDGTRDFLRSLSRSARVSAHSFSRNSGKAAAINHAVSLKRECADWHVVLDDDAVVTPGWLTGLLAAARKHPAAAIIGCRSVDRDGRIFSAEMFSWFGGVGNGEKDEGQRSYTRFCDSVTGVCSLIRSDVFKKISFRESLRVHEDSDFCLSARKAGFRVLYCGQVVMFHEHLRRHGTNVSRNVSWMLSKWGIRSFPDSHPLDVCYTNIWNYAKRDQWERVFRECGRLRLIDPMPGYAWGLMGRALAKLGRHSEAQAALEAALSHKNLHPTFIARTMGLLRGSIAIPKKDPPLRGQTARGII